MKIVGDWRSDAKPPFPDPDIVDMAPRVKPIHPEFERGFDRGVEVEREALILFLSDLDDLLREAIRRGEHRRQKGLK